MICPSCKTPGPRTVDTLPSGLQVSRKRACDACGSTWLTTETVNDGSLWVGTGGNKKGQAGTGAPSRSSSDLDLFSGSESSPDQYQKSSGDRECDGPATQALAVVRPAKVAKGGGLYEQVASQFQAAYFAERGCDYVLTAADKSQIGRFLNPGRGNPPPTPALLEKLPAIFAAFAQETREFERRQGLAWLLTKGLNAYLAIAHGAPLRPPTVSRKSRAQIDDLMAIAQRGANRDEG